MRCRTTATCWKSQSGLSATNPNQHRVSCSMAHFSMCRSLPGCRLGARERPRYARPQAPAVRGLERAGAGAGEVHAASGVRWGRVSMILHRQDSWSGAIDGM